MDQIVLVTRIPVLSDTTSTTIYTNTRSILCTKKALIALIIYEFHAQISKNFQS